MKTGLRATRSSGISRKRSILSYFGARLDTNILKETPSLEKRWLVHAFPTAAAIVEIARRCSARGVFNRSHNRTTVADADRLNDQCPSWIVSNGRFTCDAALTAKCYYRALLHHACGAVGKKKCLSEVVEDAKSSPPKSQPWVNLYFVAIVTRSTARKIWFSAHWTG
jgi:hypothetical protein